MNASSSTPIDIGSKTDFPEGKGREVKVKGRSLSIFRYKSKLYAMDHHCYHMGGPLAEGDIEDITLNNEIHPCVVCPWHKYNVSLITGEGIYKHEDPFLPPATRQKTSCMKSRGKKQRLHEIYEVDSGGSGGRVMVKLNESKSFKYESDRYSEGNNL